MVASHGHQVLALRYDCACFPKNYTIHAGAIPITARVKLSYSFESGKFTFTIPGEKVRGEFYPTIIVKIDGSEIWTE